VQLQQGEQAATADANHRGDARARRDILALVGGGLVLTQFVQPDGEVAGRAEGVG
jgi:hypothetical protein